MNALSAYRENTVTTQSRGRIVVMLYDGAIKAIRQAMLLTQQGETDEANQQLCKAGDIIDELNAVLDMDAGGEVAQNLRNLYLFMMRHIVKAMARKDTRIMAEIVKLLEELNQGWKTIADEQTA